MEKLRSFVNKQNQPRRITPTRSTEGTLLQAVAEKLASDDPELARVITESAVIQTNESLLPSQSDVNRDLATLEAFIGRSPKHPKGMRIKK